MGDLIAGAGAYHFFLVDMFYVGDDGGIPVTFYDVCSEEDFVLEFVEKFGAELFVACYSVVSAAG